MKNFLAIILVLVLNNGFAQKSPEFKFTKVTEADLSKKVYDIDSGAGAIIIADVGSSEIVGNSKNWFGFTYTRRKRVHILNKSGYDEGDVEIYLYVSGQNEEKLTSVKATTYNLQEGKVVETKMEKSAVFSDRLD